MSIERLKSLKERAMALAEQGINQDVSCIDAKELGEVIDIIKDLSEAVYYCKITEAMDKTDEEEKYMQKYLPEMAYARSYSPYYKKPMDYPEMFYSGTGSMGSSSGNGSSSGYARGRGRRNYYEPNEVHTYTDGESWQYRRNYMDDKMNHKDDTATMEDLDDYMKSLADDIMEMISDSTTQEKTMLKQKLTTLASKIS